jgi:peptidoglycan/LPS O-acetylase OafA/YrhL
MLILLLVSVRASGNRWIYWLTCAILGLAELVALSPLSLFIAGHIAAHGLRRTGSRRWETAVGSIALLSGVLSCSSGKIGVLSSLSDLLSRFRAPVPDEWEIQQKMIGACLIFGGLALLPILRQVLELPVARWFGKISFSLYLVHFPLLFTCAAAGFANLSGALPYGASLALVGIAGIAASIAFAAGFERWVDRPAILLSRMIGRRRPRQPDPDESDRPARRTPAFGPVPP